MLSTPSIIQQKNQYRTAMKFKRMLIEPSRRESAVQNMLEVLPSILEGYDFVLSYASFDSELSTKSLNQALIEMGSLVLPAVKQNTLCLYKVEDIRKQLRRSHWGIFEPNPSLCEEIDVALIQMVIVPGLAFDPFNHRLGYGKGCYDRLLAACSPYTTTIGIGFAEQRGAKIIPVLPTDIPLQQPLLF